MTDKVYVISSSAGMDDEFHWWIDGIFTDPIVAEEQSRFIKSTAKEIKDGCPKDEDSIEYYEYYCKHRNMIEFNNCTVEEYELNKLIK